MEMLAWMWVWDKRMLFSMPHSQNRIVLAWLIPLQITTVVLLQHIINDERSVFETRSLTDSIKNLLLAMSLFCLLSLIYRQCTTHNSNVDFLWRSELVYSWTGICLLIVGLINSLLAITHSYNSDDKWLAFYYQGLTLPCFYWVMFVFLAGICYKLLFVLGYALCPLKLLQLQKWHRR